MRSSLDAIRLAIAAWLVMFAAASVSCSALRPPASGNYTINITSGGYRPTHANVQAGTLVTWINQDSQPHTATSPGAFDSGVIAPNGGQWSWVASASGTTLTYQDMVGQSFQGTLEIQPITPTGQ